MSRPRRWRWLRLVSPVLVVLALIIATGVLHALNEPDASDPDFLNPRSTAPLGSATLAGQLAARGITVLPVDRGSRALVEAFRGDATLLIPAPALLHPFSLRMLKLLPATVRVVLVQPTAAVLDRGNLPFLTTGSRWATKVVQPGCADPAGRGGPAAVWHDRYAGLPPDEATGPLTVDCYGGAVLGTRIAHAEVLVVGASDPFRNDRIAESHNAALATALLTGYPRLVWLDLHHTEARPGLVSQPPGQGGPAAPPSLGTGGSPDPDFPIQDGTDAPGKPPVLGGKGTSPTDPGLPLPVWVFAAVAGLAGAALLAALAAGRRLGPPVTEPLPVTVHAAETVYGRGRLYRRAQARGPALRTLLDSAARRLRAALDLPPGADLAAAVAARTGDDPQTVAAILDRAAPVDDRALVGRVAELDDLVQRALGARPPAPSER